MLELREKDHSKFRWIKPIPEIDPDVELEMRLLSPRETEAIFDEYKVPANARGSAAWQKFGKAGVKIVQRSVNDWKGIVEKRDGKPVPLECNDKTKPRLLDHIVPGSAEDGGPDRNLWQVAQDVFREEEEAEEKNS